MVWTSSKTPVRRIFCLAESRIWSSAFKHNLFILWDMKFLEYLGSLKRPDAAWRPQTSAKRYHVNKHGTHEKHHVIKYGVRQASPYEDMLIGSWMTFSCSNADRVMQSAQTSRVPVVSIVSGPVRKSLCWNSEEVPAKQSCPAMSEADAKSCCSVASACPRSRMDVVCVIDLVTGSGSSMGRLAQRKAAYEEVQKASRCVGADLHELPFKKLDFGETKVLDLFYNADVAVVDVSIQIACSSYPLSTYKVNDAGVCVVTEPPGMAIVSEETVESKQPLHVKLKKFLQDVEVQTK
ncbi:hypothetical protein HPB47_012842 [Ixodes persulcatus]|uniref:Uncharacterized protein n=1 Tax=Ixodes persulcatus TaxID=34615 RepID=A0AC60NSF8_IXOPE|nr:hypothetical protein HPB47_012842 [Ixodes persulcatus]